VTAETLDRNAVDVHQSRRLLVAGLLALRRDDLPVAREFLAALEREGAPADFAELAAAIRIEANR
jgi:hypothetical protein